MRLRRSRYILEEETGENNICEVVDRKLNGRKNRRGGGRKGEQLVCMGFVMVEGVGVMQQIRIICSLGMARN